MPGAVEQQHGRGVGEDQTVTELAAFQRAWHAAV